MELLLDAGGHRKKLDDASESMVHSYIYSYIYIYILVTLVYSTIYISTLLFIMHAWHFAQKLVKC